MKRMFGKGKKGDKTKDGKKQEKRKSSAEGQKKAESEAQSTGVDELGMRSQELQKPPDQLELTDQEKNKEHTRILTANNPHAPHNIVRFSFKEAEFRQTSAVDQLAVHFSLNGNLIHTDSDEARRQKQRLANAKSVTKKSTAAGDSDDDSEDEEVAETHDQGVGADEGDKEVLRNQFNFSERAAQTFNNPYRDRQDQTEPPPRGEFKATANQWEIFDAYKADQARQQREKDKAGKKVGRGKGDDDRSALLAKKRAALELEKQMTAGDDLSKISRAAKIIERMVNQNTASDIAEDFKYYDDEADEFREGQGTLLPLWKFNTENSKKMSVTSTTWSNQYSDLFACGYGSFNFSKQSSGALMMYSCKNPSHPEYSFLTDSGVMSIDIHTDKENYICVGFYNGDVAVFNLSNGSTGPEFRNNVASGGKHTDPVWQVKWQPNNLDGLMNFCSVSGDGNINNWVLVKNELMCTNVVGLKNINSISDLDDQLATHSLASGTALAFHPTDNNLFLAGTEEGKVFKCSSSYKSRYLDVLPAHHMTVEAIKWSPFHSDVFMTCSQDWFLKVWDHNFPKQPLFVFELGAAVGDCAWANHSATVFSAVTNDGKVHVFDLSANKYDSLVSQVVTNKKKTKLTSVQFNPMDPILCVGDDRGNVTTLKLSPNLRKLPKLKKGQVYKLDHEVEKSKLEKIVELVRSK
jgi:dynein intermediate chain 1